MKAEEINALAVLIAKCLNDNFNKDELIEVHILLCQVTSNIITYIKIK